MHSNQRHGLDYTPLYKFLLKQVGRPWNDVVSEALPRLDGPDALSHIVADHFEDAQDIVRTGQSSFFGGLYVDSGGILTQTNPTLTAQKLFPSCACCTHSFNGERFGQAYDATQLNMVCST